MATTLVRRLADGPDAQGDTLEELLSGGFLVPSGAEGPGDLAAVGGSDQVIVLVGGESADPGVADVLVPMARGLSGQGFNVAAAEQAATERGFVRTLRDGPASETPMVTVDNVDEPAGVYALVLGLEQLLGEQRAGDFGYKPGATALIPPR